MSSGSPSRSPPNSGASKTEEEPLVARVETIIRGIAEGNPQQVMALVVGIFVGIITLAVIFWLMRGKKRGRTIIMAGICESGKTSMFARLVHKKAVATYTSARENYGDFKPAGKSGLILVDVPGHERLRQKYIEHYKTSVRGIIYVVDSSNVQKQLRDTAEFLFNIISDPILFAARPPLLVACNKQDAGLAKGSGVIKRELQKELNLLRDTHSRSLQGTNDSPVVDHTYLGRKGHDFEFQDLPMKVDFCETSCDDAENGFDHLKTWLADVA